MNIDKKLLKDIEDFCKVNKIDEDEYINKLLKDSFLKDKYGEKPEIFIKKESKKEVEPIVEKEKNVQVETVFTKNDVFMNTEHEEKTEQEKVESKKEEKKPRKRKLS